ncbi:winged helix-turn-helix domain-containing protein [Algicella marina]|uniref:LysR family transcriptional regulator n=1 Tax=Algicella marina TaxID=2683284 RepID=A0A6P1T3A4_9RHOB|nr:LysR family transcriptional regulator [Algicella marina]QHQ36241.1 LysR family transcriptional regulator [Algicella marina]
MPAPFDKPAIRTKIYVGTDMIGGGKVDFLQLVADHGTIAAAAADMGVTTTRAWFFLDTLQACFAAPLFEGPREENAPITITPLGHELIARFSTHADAVRETARPFLDWLAEVQPRKD